LGGDWLELEELEELEVHEDWELEELSMGWGLFLGGSLELFVVGATDLDLLA